MLLGNHHMEHDGFSDKSEREAHDDWDTTANDNGGRLTEESDMDQSDELSLGLQATAYVEQHTEEMAEVSTMFTVIYPKSSFLFGFEFQFQIMWEKVTKNNLQHTFLFLNI